MSDIIARLGGDEFAILANEASEDSQKHIWARLKEHLCAEGSRDPRYSLSLSIGVARFDPRGAVTLEELLEYADQAMYEAKRASADPSFPGCPGRYFMSRISPDQGLPGNARCATNAKSSSTISVAPNPLSERKLLFCSRIFLPEPSVLQEPADRPKAA